MLLWNNLQNMTTYTRTDTLGCVCICAYILTISKKKLRTDKREG